MSFELICGIHAVWGRLKKYPASIVEIYLLQTRQDKRILELQTAAALQNIPIVFRSHPELDKMCSAVSHQGVAAKAETVSLPAHIDDVLDALAEPALLLVLDGVQDPHNLGACLRSADACRAHALIVPKDRAVGLTPAVRKVACGAAESIPFFAVTNLARTLRELKDRGIWVLGTAAEGAQELGTIGLKGPVAWVLGAEGEGLRRLTRETCDELIRIPMMGAVESLNVSVAVGICLFETRRQRRVA